MQVNAQMEYSPSHKRKGRPLRSNQTRLLSAWTGRQSYQYAPLPSEESFRVMELLPGKGNKQIQIKLRVVSWDNPPSYEAISYCWGDPKDVMECICDGAPLLITKSLYSGLERFRLPKKKRVLWADAVCLNQGDSHEVSHQVQRMSRIYKNGKRTLIWLGPDWTQQAECAFLAIKACWPSILSNSGEEYIDLAQEGCFSALLNLSKMDGLPLSNADRFAIGELFSQPWFKRLWVIQELNLSKSATTVWGQHEVDSFLVGIVAVYILYDALEWSSLASIYPKASPSYAARMVTWRLRNPPNTARGALGTLEYSSSYTASDPRDRIYAQLGNLDFLATHLVADYKLSTSQVLFSAALAFIYYGNGLHVLSQVHHLHDNLEQSTCCYSDSQRELSEDGICRPSWVPRWDCLDREFIPTMGISSANFQASARRSETGFFREISARKSLLLEGLVIDEVSIAEKLDLSALGFEPRSSNRLQHCQALCKLIQKGRGMESDEDIFEAYGRTLLNGDSYNKHVAKSFGLQNCKGAFTFFLHWLFRIQMGGEMQDWNHPEGIRIPKLSDMDDNKSQGSHVSSISSFRPISFRDAVVVQHRCRTFFRTSTGYIATGPLKAKPGDKVAILFGAPMPFVIRERPDGTYLLVGECYVDGIMFGEAVQDWENGNVPNVKTQRIELV